MAKISNHLVIMAGGVGSRFWPMSTAERPKQFIDVLGSGKTLLQMTVERFGSLVAAENVWVVTNERYAGMVAEQLPDLPRQNILKEPCRRNTAPCIAYVSWRIKKKDPKANIVVTPSDHVVFNIQEFQRVIAQCMEFTADSDAIVTLGMKPSRPETGYGYIQMNDDKPLSGDIFPVKSFTEKPDAEFAGIFLQEGNFLWNTGLLCFNARVMLDNLFQLVPEYRIEIPRMMAEAESDDPKLVPESFNVLPNYNMDVSILERSSNVFVQRGHFGWADLGTWASIGKDAPSDSEGNVLLDTDAHLYECTGNIIRMPKGHTAVVKGLHDFVIAEEGEFLMICPREDDAAMRRMHTDTKFGDTKS